MLQEPQSLSVTRSSTSSALDQEDDRRRKEDLAYKYVNETKLINRRYCNSC